jgi:hypothetical protein
MENNYLTDIKYIQERLASIDKNNIKNEINKIPLLSCIMYLDDNDICHRGGLLIEIRKTSIILLTNINDIDATQKVKFSNIQKIYYVYNARTYRRQYENQNKEKMREKYRKRYLKKKALREQEIKIT